MKNKQTTMTGEQLYESLRTETDEQLRNFIHVHPDYCEKSERLLLMIVEKLEGLSAQIKELNENLEKEAELDR